MDKAFIQKLVWTVLAIGVYVLTVFVPDVSSDLKVIAGLIIGAVWINAKEGARTSVRPPPVPAKPGDWLEPLVPLLSHAAAMSIAFGAITACAGAPQAVTDARDHVADMRARAKESADRMRSDLSMARGVLDAFSASVDALCGFQRVSECDNAADAIRVLDAAHKAALTAVDTVESTGLALDSVAEQVKHVVIQARVLGETVRALGSEVANAVDQRADRASAPGDSGSAGAPSPEGAAPAAAP